MKAPSPPPSPDPYKTAAAQQMANVEVAIANTWMTNADEIRPDADVTFQQLSGTGNEFTSKSYNENGTVIAERVVNRWKKTVTLKGKAQTNYDLQQAISEFMNEAAKSQAQRLQVKFGTEFKIDNLNLPVLTLAPNAAALAEQTPVTRNFIPAIGQSDDIVAEKGYVREALVERLNWQSRIERDLRITKLANMGIFPGMTAYEREIAQFDRQVTDNRVQIEAVVGQEHSRMIEVSRMKADFYNHTAATEFQIAMARLDSGNRIQLQKFDVLNSIAQFTNQVRGMRLQEHLLERSLITNEISALMHGGQVNIPQGERFQAGRISDTPVADSVYKTAQLDMQKWQTQVQYQQSMFGSMMGMFGSIFGGAMRCSPHFKTDIDDAGAFLARVRQLEVKTWRYKPEVAAAIGDSDTHIGPMADQWAELFGGNGVTISPIDAFGVLFQCVKELLARIERLEAERTPVEAFEFD